MARRRGVNRTGGIGDGTRSGHAPVNSSIDRARRTIGGLGNRRSNLPPPARLSRGSRSRVGRTLNGNNTRGSGHRGGECVDLPPDPAVSEQELTRIGRLIKTMRKKLPGYDVYYPTSPPTLPELDNKMKAIERYLRDKGYLEEERMDEIEAAAYFEVICEEVIEMDVIQSEWSTFREDLESEPTEVIQLWSAVLHKLMKEERKRMSSSQNSRFLPTPPSLRVILNKRCAEWIQAGFFFTSGPIIPLHKINTFHIGRFVTICGTVIRSGELRPTCLQLTFMCKSCNGTFIKEQMDGIFTLPTKCGGNIGCINTRYFEVKESDTNNLVVDMKRVRIQANIESERGGIPKTMNCELYGQIGNKCNSYEVLTLSGVVKLRKDEGQKGGEQNLHDLYVDVSAVRRHKDDEKTMGGQEFIFSNKDFVAIAEIHDTPKLFRLLVASLSPRIYGHEYVKAGLLLSLFGGSRTTDDSKSIRRNNINILLVGDPGLGKSVLLQQLVELSPRGIYVCGPSTTTCGLTATIVREGDNYSIEAGALVLADNGLCALDELDKMKSQHPALLEVMEQQTVSIAKAGICRTYPARTTIVSAANPINGHYDKRKSMMENVNISSPLLSRFDLIYLILDREDRERDRRLAEHIMGFKSGTQVGGRSTPDVLEAVLTDTLMDRLRVRQNEELDLLPKVLIRKYVAYSNEYVRPVLSPTAISILKDYYLKLRVKHRGNEELPVTTRQLESLIRLTEARAKVELREVCTSEDARDVIEIFESTLADVENVAVTLDSPCPATNAGSREQARKLLGILQSFSKRRSKSIFTRSEIDGFVKSAYLSAETTVLIDLLNVDGNILLKAGHTYQLRDP